MSSALKDEIYEEVFKRIQTDNKNTVKVTGRLTKIVYKNGIKVKEITLNPTVFLFYLKTKILTNKEDIALKLINSYGKYFDDIVLANIKYLE